MRRFQKGQASVEAAAALFLLVLVPVIFRGFDLYQKIYWSVVLDHRVEELLLCLTYKEKNFCEGNFYQAFYQGGQRKITLRYHSAYEVTASLIIYKDQTITSHQNLEWPPRDS